MTDEILCAPCQDRGHRCYTNRIVDGVALCVFCEDKEPCLYDQRNSPQALIAKKYKEERNQEAEKTPMPIGKRECGVDGCKTLVGNRSKGCEVHSGQKPKAARKKAAK